MSAFFSQLWNYNHLYLNKFQSYSVKITHINLVVVAIMSYVTLDSVQHRALADHIQVTLVTSLQSICCIHPATYLVSAHSQILNRHEVDG